MPVSSATPLVDEHRVAARRAVEKLLAAFGVPRDEHSGDTLAVSPDL